MPWDTNDYPSSWKNLETTIRKKAIEIGNAMLDEGYKEGQAIPIATEQAKEWYANASEKEKNQILNEQDKELKKRDSSDTQSDSRPELLEKGEHVFKREDDWVVQSEDAKQASGVFDKKEDAIKRGREIAKNKETHLVIYNADGSVQEKQSYDEK
ncbi:DUF2188 domain-containing protein [Salipaludibacillus sp. CF4.18]|uniref:DUF2188 domain-containing protein n=1 Tax=Salipaludibacillus sp. CF4.18 TaxID=3373081 RepID=UPI003EE6CCF2